MAKSKIRVAFESIGAARVAGDFRLLNESGRQLQRTLSALAKIDKGALGGIEAAGKSASKAAKGFSELRKATSNFPSTKQLIDNLARLGAVDTSGLGKAAGSARALSRALSGLGSSAAGAQSAANSVASLAAVGPGGMNSVARAINSLSRSLSGINGAGAGLQNLAVNISALSAVPLGNLANLGRALRDMAKGVRDLSAAAPNLAPLAAGLRLLGNELSSRRLQRGLSSFAGLAPGLSDLANALRRMGNSAPGIAALGGAIATLAASLNNPAIRRALQDFAAFGPALAIVARSLSALSRSANNFSNLNLLAQGIDRVNQSLRALAQTSNDQNLQRLLQNLRDIRAASGGAGGGGRGRGGGNAAAGLSGGAGITSLVTTPFGFAKQAATLALSGVSAIATGAAKSVGLILGATQTAIGGMIQLGKFGISTLDGIAQKAAVATRALSRIAVATALGTGGAGLVLKKAFESDNDLTQIENTLKVVTGSAEAARAKFSEIAPEIDRMGFAISDLAPAFAKFSAAAIGTSLAGAQVEEAFFAVANAGRALGISTNDQRGILLALQQVISKGTVQAEELRSQISERLPGAFNIAARAIGVTREEFDKLLKAGKVSAADFIPKFSAQLNKEFGGVAGSAERPAAALDRLKNSFFEAFTVIGRSGGTALVVRGLNAISEAVRKLVADGTIAAFTKSFVARFNRIGDAVGRTMKTVSDAISILSGNTQVRIGLGEIASDNKSAVKLANTLSDLRTIIGGFSRDVAIRLNAAVRGAGVGFDDVNSIIGIFDRVMFFTANTVLPAVIRGVQNVYSILSSGARYVRDFVNAFGTIRNGLGFQLNYLINQMTGVKNGVSDAFGISPGKLAFGVTYGVYLINKAVLTARGVIADFRDFIDRLDENGTFKRMAKDARDFVSVISGISLGSDATKAPDTLADAFSAAYETISDGIRKAYAEVSKFSNAFMLGFKFENTAKDEIRKNALSGNDRSKQLLESGKTPDIKGVGEDQNIATLGQQIARLFNALKSAAGPLTDIAIGYADALSKAATWLVTIIDKTRELVGDEAFGKIAGLVAGLLLLNKIGGFSILGSSVGSLAGGIIGSMFSGLAAIFKDFLIKFALVASGGASSSALAALGAIGLTGSAAFAAISAAGKANDTQGSRQAQEEGRKALSEGDYLGVAKSIIKGAYAAADADGIIGDFLQRNIYNPNANGMTTREIVAQRDAQAALATRERERNKASNDNSKQSGQGFGQDFGKLTLVNPDGKERDFYTPREGFQGWTSWDSAQRQQQGQNGQQSSPFYGGQ